MNHWSHKTESGGWQSSAKADWSWLRSVCQVAIGALALLAIAAAITYVDYVTGGIVFGPDIEQWGQ